MSVPSVVVRSAFVLSAIVLFAFDASSQRLTQGPKPKTQLSEFSEAFCSSLSGGFRVCKGRTSEQGDAEYVVMKADSIVNRIPAAAWTTVAISPDGFFAYRGDLDRDGSQEVVLVSLENVSNGMGVTYSTAYIFDGRTLEVQGTPISFPIQEFGERENFIYNAADRRTEVLISYWGEYSTLEPNRIPGVYLIGKWFRYRSGKLEPVAEKPTLARRFLNSFAAERDNGWFENRKPYTWLKDRRTHKLYREPRETTKPIATLTAAIKSFEDGETPAVQFETASGEIVKGIFGSRASDDAGNAKPLAISSIGIWKNKYTYPLSYSMKFDPSVFLEQIEGRKVRVEKYRSDYGDEYVKVWLLE